MIIKLLEIGWSIDFRVNQTDNNGIGLYDGCLYGVLNGLNILCKIRLTLTDIVIFNIHL